MNLLTFLFRLPWFPVQGFVKLASVIKEEAERSTGRPRHDPARAGARRAGAGVR